MGYWAPTSTYTSIKKFLRARRRYVTKGLVSSLYEFFFVAGVEECPYFPTGMDSFAVLLKGKSLEQLPKYEKQFECCFLANNFDEEIRLIGDSLIGKKCVHFANRLMTAPLKPENYKKLNITDVQLMKVSACRDRRLKLAADHYKSLGLNVHFLPKKLIKFNKDFGMLYSKKYPNTGILTIVYALEMLRPKTLWVMGLDFYQSDYLTRRPHQSPIEVQRRQMEKIKMAEITANTFRRYPEVKINMVSYYKGFPAPPNVEILS